MIIRPITNSDLEAVVSIHCLSFPESALTKLGRSVVSAYYKWQLEGPHDSWKLCLTNNDSVVAFCIFGRFQGAVSGFVKRNRLLIISRCLLRPWFLLSGDFRKRVAVGLKAVFTRAYDPSNKPTEKDADKAAPSLGVLAIAVAPSIMGRGGGKALMIEAERIAVKAGCGNMHLTVSPNNHRAIAFYESLGWKKAPGNDAWQGLMKKELLVHAV